MSRCNDDDHSILRLQNWIAENGSLKTFDLEPSFLMIAAEVGHLECLQLLLKAGCSLYDTDYTNETALHKASNNGHYEILKILLEAGCQDRHSNYYGTTALELAIIQGHQRCAELLLDHGSTWNKDDILYEVSYWPELTQRSTKQIETSIREITEYSEILVKSAITDNPS